MIFNAESILRKHEILDIHFRDVSYSPLFSTTGLVAADGFNGIESIVLNYNRKCRTIWDDFIKFEDGLVRVPSSMEKLSFANGNKKADITFYGKDMFVISAENTECIELCGTISENCVGVWVESSTNDTIVLRGYSLNGDARDPDQSVPYRAGIKAIKGSVNENDKKIKVTANHDGKIFIAFAFEALDTSEESIAESLEKAPKSIEEAIKISENWFSDMLYGFETTVESEKESEILTHALKGLLFNSTIGQGMLNGYVSAYPSRGEYPTHFLWDSCFQNLALEYLNPRLAKDSLLMYHHYQRVDGKFPQFLCSTWARPHETQPALIGWATMRIVNNAKEKDMDFIEKMFSALEKNNQWWLNQRMTRHGVLYCPHGLETGQDDSPRFDNGPILALDMNSYLLSQMRATAELAKILGNEKAVEKWTKKADILAENMIRVMYDSEQNMFFDADPVTAERRTLWSASGFLPLWAGVDIGEAKAKAMIKDHLLNEKKFFGRIPLPCIAYDQAEYKPEKWWRGPTWMSLSWMVNEVLLKYGFEAEHRHVCEAFHEMILKDGNLRELFNSQTGEGLGAYDQGWTAAVFVKLHKMLRG